ncbi:GNAT family N-acetyltransferase [Cytobacillus suaedae]|nr:GNAT family N-acetyltransferase [Cytobacillus suaedae]
MTRENWEECIDLRVSVEQQKFVASNLFSIAEAQFLPNFEALAIYHEDMMVGFTMYGLDPDDNNYWIYRLMIDEKQQGKGYGKHAIKEVLANLMKKPDCQLIMVGYHQENMPVHHLYKSVGFVDKGIAPWGEQLAGYEVK